MRIPRARRSTESITCLHKKTYWKGPFDLTIGTVDYTYKQKWCKQCGKFLANGKPKKKS